MYSKSNDMKSFYMTIQEILFGVSVRGEVLPEPKPIKIREEVNQTEFEKWCEEYRFGVLWNKQSIFNNQ